MPREGARRPRRAARRRAGRGGGQRRGARRRRRRARMRRRSRSAWARPSPSSTARTKRLQRLSAQFGVGAAGRSIRPAPRSPSSCRSADLVIGAVLMPGAAAPKLITRDMLQDHAPGRGASSTSPSTRAAAARPRSRRPIRTRPMSSTASCIIASPTCRARSRAPRPSRSTTRRCPSRSRSPTRAGAQALKDDPHLRAGLNVHDGKVTCEPVAAAHGLAYTPAETVLAA